MNESPFLSECVMLLREAVDLAVVPKDGTETPASRLIESAVNHWYRKAVLDVFKNKWETTCLTRRALFDFWLEAHGERASWEARR